MKNIMWFSIRDTEEWHQVEATNETLELLMNTLFSEDDYVFRFETVPPFEIVSPAE